MNQRLIARSPSLRTICPPRADTGRRGKDYFPRAIPVRIHLRRRPRSANWRRVIRVAADDLLASKERGSVEGTWGRGRWDEDAAIAGSDSGGGGVRVDADTAVGQGSISYPSGYGRRDPPTCSSTPRRASVRRRLIWG